MIKGTHRHRRPINHENRRASIPLIGNFSWTRKKPEIFLRCWIVGGCHRKQQDEENPGIIKLAVGACRSRNKRKNRAKRGGTEKNEVRAKREIGRLCRPLNRLLIIHQTVFRIAISLEARVGFTGVTRGKQRNEGWGNRVHAFQRNTRSRK